MNTGDSTAEKASLALVYADAPAVEQSDPKKALGELAREHHRALVHFLLARVGSKDRAEELAQETYAKVLALDTPNAVSFLAGYVWKTAQNLATNAGVQKANRARLDNLAHPSVERHAPSPESAVYERQRLELLSTALDGLRQIRPRWYEAFILRVVEGQSFAEVAQAMRIAQRNAMEYVARAARHCQEYLDAAEATRGTAHGEE